jgi:hypothetical protein
MLVLIIKKGFEEKELRMKWTIEEEDSRDFIVPLLKELD